MNQQMINIGGDPNDINYRYKMPPLQVKIEGRGNGIKTVLTNIVDVCKHLHTQPEWCTRFFGIVKGAVSNYDKKRDVGIVHGQHDAKTLQQSLKLFITDFILCPKCKLPELQQKVHQERSLLLARCASCGWKGEIKSTHKVKQFIISSEKLKYKKPSTTSSSSHDTKEAGGKTKSSLKDAPLVPKEIQVNINALGGENDEVWSVDIDEGAVKKRKLQEMQALANKKNKKVSQNEMEDVNNEDNNNNNDNDNETKENDNNKNDNNDNKNDNNMDINVNDNDNIKDIDNDNADNNNNNNNDDDDDDNNNNNQNPYTTTATTKNDEKDDSAANVLKIYIKEHNPSIIEIVHEIKRLCLAREFNDDIKRNKMIFEAVCDFKDENTFIASLKKNAPLFKYFNKTDTDTRKFFGVFEEIVARRNRSKLLPKTFKILECIYDAEIATPDQIISWYESATDHSIIVDKSEADEIRAKAKVFYEWLKSDDDDDDNEDDDEN